MFICAPKLIDAILFLGAAQCLGELYRHFGKKITSGLFETTSIVTKLVKFNEVSQFTLHLSSFCHVE